MRPIDEEERRILYKLLAGKPRGEICTHLEISPSTFRDRLEHIRVKLDACNTYEAMYNLGKLDADLKK